MNWHTIFSKIAKKTKEPFSLTLVNSNTVIYFWKNQYQVCEPGNMPTNYKVR